MEITKELAAERVPRRVGISDGSVRSSTVLRLALIASVAVTASGCPFVAPLAGATGRVVGGGIAAAQRQDYSVADAPDPPPPPETCPDKPVACVAGKVVAFENRGVGWQNNHAACVYAERITEDCGTGYCEPATARCFRPCEGMAKARPDACSDDGLATVTQVWVAEGRTADTCRLETRSVPCQPGRCDPSTAACVGAAAQH